MAATGTNEGQAYKRLAASISTLAHGLVRAAEAAGLPLSLEDAKVLVKGKMPAAGAVADDVHLVFYWGAAQREAGLPADAPIGALQSVMNAAVGESKRHAHARTCGHHASAPPRPPTPTANAPAPSPALRKCVRFLGSSRRFCCSPSTCSVLQVSYSARTTSPTLAADEHTLSRPGPGKPSGFLVVPGGAEGVRGPALRCGY